MNLWYSMETSDLEETLESDSEEGLSDRWAEDRLRELGKNKLKEGSKSSIFNKLLCQLKDPTILILLVAASISFFIGETKNMLIIMLIVIVNTIIGIIQEQKAEDSLDAIKKLTSPKAHVVRDGVEKFIDIEFLVPGDLVVLEAGDYIPADIRLTECYDLKVDESTLTGESISVEKVSRALKENDCTLGDCVNMVFMGCNITYGRGKGLVVKTGMNTEIGKIANMLGETKKQFTPLQIKLKELSKILAVISLSVCGLIFIIGLLQGQDTYEVFLNAFSLAVASVPEGLPAIVTVVLALGMQIMARKNAIMKTLPAVETCGAANIICSDKTGTLTQNKMTVTNIYVNEVKLDLANRFKRDVTVEKLLIYGLLCNDTTVQYIDSNYDILGDPTEVALVNLAIANGINPMEERDKYKRIEEIPFSSERKLMTTVNQLKDSIVSITKGAPEVILSRCTQIEKRGLIYDISKEDIINILNANKYLSEKALRVLAIGYKFINEENGSKKDVIDMESQLVFLGLYGMIDPPREDVKQAIDECITAGIRPIMITGDHEITATAIAKDLQIIKNEDNVINGRALDELSDDQLESTIENYRVFARVSPEHKLKIVKALQKAGNVVVMTGDGVNDAPALKKADIGVAMGISGTEVAKGAADMVLADDDFGTIVSAVKYGRVVYNNIRKAVHFLLSGNISEIVSIFLATILGPVIFDVPISFLSAIQILWINLVSDSLLAIALAFEGAEPGIMNKNPRNIKDSILSDGLGIKIAYQGFLIGAITFGAYIIGYNMSHGLGENIALKTANTMAFMTLAFIQFFHVFNTRSLNNSIFKLGIFSNKYLNIAFLINVLLQIMTIMVPCLRDSLFGLVKLSVLHWVIIIGLSMLPIVIVELEKLCVRKYSKAKLTLTKKISGGISEVIEG